MKKQLKILKTHSINQILIKVLKRLSIKRKYYINKYIISKNPNLYNSKKLRNFNSKMNFYFDYNNKNKILDYYDQNIHKKDKVINEANLILEHKFDLLGSGLRDLGKEIQWNKDFKTNYFWENKFYKDIKIIDFKNSADVKVPWELSRFNQLFTLGKAFWITNDKKYYNEFKNQLISWNEQNPYNHSVNWTNTMEVGVRAINIIFAYHHFKEEIKNDSSFHMFLNELVYLHGKFIRNNLENYNHLRNNHYVANLVGLLYIGVYFRGNKFSEKWIYFAQKELMKEINTQINVDGTSYETSTNYQRVVAELFLHAYMISKNNNFLLDNEFELKLYKMNVFLKHITKPNGLTPLIGDIDNGRLLIFSDYYDWDKRNYNQMLNVAGYFLGKNDLYYNISQYEEELLWLTNNTAFTESKPCHDSVGFSEGGYYILRNNSFYVFIRCGELSMRGQGGHSHNDQLSIELNIKGKDIIIDPGSYTYTGSVKLRNIDRSTCNHNTLIIEGIEQNTFNDDIFTMNEETFSKRIDFNQRYFAGEHYGFIRKANTVHSRKVTLDDLKLTIEDELSYLNKNLKCYQVLILDPKVSSEYINDKLFFRVDEIEVFTNINKADCIIKDTYISRGYGNRIKTRKILIAANNISKITFFLHENEGAETN
ncbi:hypothetical protein JMA_29400 [Jeotgalibacillus malaysiensis]|uniref:Uncharacterized protein n=1 Tax=Jeotgalibacillus malaysiensis TaxID=1508404 RepID=A0A0B5AU56_9BACL|nr:alginate lyase family protein [Jeotgalibacillus malaysiensis]AJD92257.1 hypothetical protein JMA_29400 [Jeotgalibacillus malaysiensis]